MIQIIDHHENVKFGIERYGT